MFMRETCCNLGAFSSLKECEKNPKISYVTVFERPGLQEFLNQLSEFADLVLFTAGLEGLRILLILFSFLLIFLTLVTLYSIF